MLSCASTYWRVSLELFREIARPRMPFGGSFRELRFFLFARRDCGGFEACVAAIPKGNLINTEKEIVGRRLIQSCVKTISAAMRSNRENRQFFRQGVRNFYFFRPQSIRKQLSGTRASVRPSTWRGCLKCFEKRRFVIFFLALPWSAGHTIG